MLLLIYCIASRYAAEVSCFVPSTPYDDEDIASAPPLHVACQASSHSIATSPVDRENALKRSISNAYLYLFAHLAIIRLKNGRVHVRAFDD